MHWALIEDSRHESVHPRESAWKWAPLKICADFSCMSRAGWLLVAYTLLHIKGCCCRVSHSHPPASNWDLLITHLAENSAFDAMYKIAKHCTGYTSSLMKDVNTKDTIFEPDFFPFACSSFYTSSIFIINHYLCSICIWRMSVSSCALIKLVAL